jgi:hypothetical protein
VLRAPQFFYVHLLILISALYLPMFAYTLAANFDQLESMCEGIEAGHFCYHNFQQEVISTVVVFLQNIVVIGLEKAGQQLSDPYGEDDVDLPVHHFVTFTLRSSLKMLAADPDKEMPTIAIEKSIARTVRALRGG